MNTNHDRVCKISLRTQLQGISLSLWPIHIRGKSKNISPENMLVSDPGGGVGGGLLSTLNKQPLLRKEIWMCQLSLVWCSNVAKTRITSKTDLGWHFIWSLNLVSTLDESVLAHYALHSSLCTCVPYSDVRTLVWTNVGRRIIYQISSGHVYILAHNTCLYCESGPAAEDREILVYIKLQHI